MRSQKLLWNAKADRDCSNLQECFWLCFLSENVFAGSNPQNCTEGEWIVKKQIGSFDAVRSTSPIWTTYHRNPDTLRWHFETQFESFRSAASQTTLYDCLPRAPTIVIYNGNRDGNLRTSTYLLMYGDGKCTNSYCGLRAMWVLVCTHGWLSGISKSEMSKSQRKQALYTFIELHYKFQRGMGTSELSLNHIT